MVFASEDTITQLAVERWSTAHSPRMAELLPKLVVHLHDFARETNLTHEEWMAGLEFLEALGHISDEKRKELILASDVFGLSMLVVMLNAKRPKEATPNTVLGPFHIDDSPILDNNGNLSEDIPGQRLYVSGTVRDLKGNPVPGALLDIWQSDADGTYESQLGIDEARLRALLYADDQGKYGFWTIAPKGYSIPMDGPVGALIEKTDISYYRPAHIHFLITADGHETLITHLFKEGGEFLETDVVFGTVAELVTPFIENEAGKTPTGEILPEPYLTINYDFVLVPDKA